jgi:Putative peptidoglycan binding domain/L,D-transpeptidase catalytic domain
MAAWRGTSRRTGLLGIAIAAWLGLAACGTASGQTGAAADVPTTTTTTTTTPATTTRATGTSAAGSGQAAQGTSQADRGSGRPMPGAEATRPKPAAPALPATAHPGDHGKGVAALQRQLAALGYEVRKVDGQYGPATQHAVVAFQKVNHLSRDGVAGPKTMKALAHPRRPRPRMGGRGLHVEADLTLQVIYVVSNGRIGQILDASSASGRTYLSHGSVHRAHTPEGSFRIGRKVDGWHRSYLGLMYRPAYFDGPYAIHGAPSVPPYPASHGCIRVTTVSMDSIYSKLVPGTRVLVYRT